MNRYIVLTRRATLRYAMSQRKVKKLKEQVDLENADPEDFAVFVRNVPEDVTAEEVRGKF